MADHYFEGIIQRHKPGRGSKPVPLERHVEAAQKSKPVVRCKQGESFEAFERRMFKRCRRGFDDAIRDAVVAMEDANLTPETIQDFKNIVADFCGDTWSVDPRAEG